MKALELFSQTSGRQTLGQGAVSLWQPCTEQYVLRLHKAWEYIFSRQMLLLHAILQAAGPRSVATVRLEATELHGPRDQAQRTRHSVPPALDDRVCSAGASRYPPPSPPANPGCAGCVLMYMRKACIPGL